MESIQTEVFQPPAYIQVIKGLIEKKIELKDGQYLKVPSTTEISFQEMNFYLDEIYRYKFFRSIASEIGVYSLIIPYHKGRYHMVLNRATKTLLIFRDTKSDKEPELLTNVTTAMSNAIVKQYNLNDKYFVKAGDFGVEIYVPSIWAPNSLKNVKWEEIEAQIEGVVARGFVKVNGKRAWGVFLRDEVTNLLEKIIEMKMEEVAWKL